MSTGDVAEFICEKHGVYKQIVYNHIVLKTSERGSGCPKCSTTLSSHENNLFKFISLLNTSAIQHCKSELKNPKTNYPLELDIYCPDKRIAFEYNGSLWHSEYVNKENDYHFVKFKLCEEKKYKIDNYF